MADLLDKAYYYQASVELNQVNLNDNLLASAYLGKQTYKYASTGQIVNVNAPASDKYYFDLNLVLSETGTQSVRTLYSVYDSFGFIGSFIMTLYAILWLISNFLTAAYSKASIF